MARTQPTTTPQSGATQQQVLSVIVKGNRFQAAANAATRGIPAVYVNETRTETVLSIGVQFQDAVLAWFCEDAGAGAPYPIGSCLHYSIKDNRPILVTAPRGADARPTILDTCYAQHWPLPVSHADLVAFVKRCVTAGIETNCSDCEWWAAYAR